MMLPRAASTAVWLAACLPWHTAVEAYPTTSSARPLPTFSISMAPHDTVYMVVEEGPRGLGTPKDFRGQGGISNSRLPAPGDEAVTAEWQRLRNIRPDASEQSIAFEDLFDVLMMDFQDNEPSWRMQAWRRIDPRQQTPAPRAWIYEIATSPNMLLHPQRDALGAERVSAQALGAVVWSQVVRFTELSPSHPTIRDRTATLTDNDAWYPSWMNSVEVSWMPNPDYDSAWETYGGVRGVPSNVFDSPRGMTRVELARDLMTLVTSSQLVSDAQRRQTLRQLLDWDIDREPGRDFPLLRHAQPIRLDAAALPVIDWSQVQIPPEVQLALVSGLATAAQCTSALRSFRNFFLGPKGKRQQEQDACRQLAVFIKDNVHVPQPCHKIKNIQLDMVLSNDFGAGTFDKVAGTLEGPAGKGDFFFAENPDRGTERTMAVDMKKSFGSDEIDINGIDKITITAEGVFWKWTSLRNDEFKIKDIRIRAECSDAAFRAENNKYIGINKPYRHPGGWLWKPFEEKTVGTLQVSPADWSFLPPCSTIKDLGYRFKIADVTGGGTYDTIYFTLGQGAKVPLGGDVAAGFSKEGAIPLKATFGKDVVDLRDLGKVVLGDDLGSSLLSGDKWTFEGITFSATCADVPKKMEMKKFESVHRDVQHKDNAPAWTGDIKPQDWLEVA